MGHGPRVSLLGSLPVCPLAPESTGHGAQQIQVNGTWSRPVGRAGVEEVLRTACKALQRNEILAYDDAERLVAELDLQAPGEDLRIHVAKTAQELHAIAEVIAQDEYPRHGATAVDLQYKAMERGGN